MATLPAAEKDPVAESDLALHEAATASVHGIADTAQLALKTEVGGFISESELEDEAKAREEADGDEAAAREAADSALAAAVAGKQDAANAATDSELANEKGDREAADKAEKEARQAADTALSAAVAAKQDASTAATDAELATEKAGREAADKAEKEAREAADATLTSAASAAQATANAALPKAGGVMVGDITLAGDPTANLHPASRQYVLAQIAALIGGAPGALDTLKEIADRLGSDESAVEALTAAVAGKLSALANLSDLDDAVEARSNLGLGSAATHPAGDFDSAGAAAAAQAASQPVDSDLTAIAALSTTEYGRSLLVQATAEAARSALGLGSAATHPAGDFDAAGAAAAAQAASQPLDSDLTAIAALSTTSFGRSVLTQGSASAARTLLELGTSATHPTGDFDAAGAAAAAAAASQPLDADLTAIAALSTTAFGRELLTKADAGTVRSAIEAANAVHASRHELGGADPLALPQYDTWDSLPYVMPMGVWPFTTITPTVKRAYLLRFMVSRKRTFKFVRFPIAAVGTGEDKVDVGIYIVNGTKMERLGSSGAKVVNFKATGVIALELTGSVVCEPGKVYFVSLSCETVTGSPTIAALNNNGGFYGDIAGTGTLANRLQLFKAEAFPLPSEITSGFTSTPCAWLLPSES